MYIYKDNKENKEIETLVYKVNTPTLDDNAFQCYFIFYLIVMFISCTVLDSYLLDLYFSTKTVNVPVLELVQVQMPLWLIINGCVGVFTFFCVFIYWNLSFYKDYIHKNVYTSFKIIFLLSSIFLVSWSIVGWMRFFRYPTTIDTYKNTFHIFMWIRLSSQSVLSITGLSVVLCMFRNV